MTPDELEQRIRDAMPADDTAPAPALWNQIASRRSAGERVLLPVDTARRSLPLIGAAIVAAGVVLALIPWNWEPAAPTDLQTMVDSTPVAPSQDNFLLPRALLAQSSAEPTYPRATLAGQRLRPGHWVHGRVLPGETQQTYFYDVSRSTHEGKNAWLLVSGHLRTDDGWRSTDSVWFSPDSLRPLYRVGNSNGARVEQTYRENDVLTGVTRNGFTTWTVVPLPDSATNFIYGGDVRVPEIAMQLQALPITDGWKASIPLPEEGYYVGVSLWLNFEVDGSETITVPGGTFDCWRVRTRWGPDPLKPYDPNNPEPGMYFWVSKQGQWLVQMSIVYNARDARPLVLLSGKEE